MVGRADAFELDAEQIVDAAMAILVEDGLAAVSMRSVSARLGVSPVPLYSRVGNKEALLEAVADRLLADVAPECGDAETWDVYAGRWAEQLRQRLRCVRDSRLIAAPGRRAYVEASRPLIAAMRRDGLAADEAVRACRLITWATVGFVALEAAAEPPPGGRHRGAGPGGDAEGVTAEDADALFAAQVRYVVEGVVRDRAVDNRDKVQP